MKDNGTINSDLRDGLAWPMTDWSADEIVVDGLVTAIEGCSPDDDNTQVRIVTLGGRPLPLHGVTDHDDQVHIVVDAVTPEVVLEVAGIVDQLGQVVAALTDPVQHADPRLLQDIQRRLQTVRGSL